MSFDQLDQSLRQTLSILRKMVAEGTGVPVEKIASSRKMAEEILRQIDRLARLDRGRA